MLKENDRLPNLVRLVFTKDEYETMKAVLNDWGCIDQTADFQKAEALIEQFAEFDKEELFDEED